MFKFSFWDRWAARRAAVNQIAPLIGHTERRLGSISELAWREPYIIGFLTTLITLVAVERTRGRLASEHLGLVQLAVWHDLTQLKDDRIGEDILLLSTNNDEGFVEGCLNARHFLAVARGEAGLSGSDLNWETLTGVANDFVPEDLEEILKGGVPVLNLWSILFETHLPGASIVSVNSA